ncbi:MAG: hypothetical protein LC793_05710 [Thermomicrobia bacterium]|nr:hypothetical protein [Thermomicrobia bacterium]
MLRELETIHVEPNSELDHLLDEAREAPVILVRNGVRYRLSIEDDPWANYDPEAVRAAVGAIAGNITPEEGERLKAAYRPRARGRGLRATTADAD